jgi:hypothetical protein
MKKFKVIFEFSDGVRSDLFVNARDEKHALEVAKYKLDSNPYNYYLIRAEEVDSYPNLY